MNIYTLHKQGSFRPPTEDEYDDDEIEETKLAYRKRQRSNLSTLETVVEENTYTKSVSSRATSCTLEGGPTTVSSAASLGEETEPRNNSSHDLRCIPEDFEQKMQQEHQQQHHHRQNSTATTSATTVATTSSHPLHLEPPKAISVDKASSQHSNNSFPRKEEEEEDVLPSRSSFSAPKRNKSGTTNTSGTNRKLSGTSTATSRSRKQDASKTILKSFIEIQAKDQYMVFDDNTDDISYLTIPADIRTCPLEDDYLVINHDQWAIEDDLVSTISLPRALRTTKKPNHRKNHPPPSPGKNPKSSAGDAARKTKTEQAATTTKLLSKSAILEEHTKSGVRPPTFARHSSKDLSTKNNHNTAVRKPKFVRQNSNDLSKNSGHSSGSSSHLVQTEEKKRIRSSSGSSKKTEVRRGGRKPQGLKPTSKSIEETKGKSTIPPQRIQPKQQQQPIQPKQQQQQPSVIVRTQQQQPHHPQQSKSPLQTPPPTVPPPLPVTNPQDPQLQRTPGPRPVREYRGSQNRSNNNINNNHHYHHQEGLQKNGLSMMSGHSSVSRVPSLPTVSGCSAMSRDNSAKSSLYLPDENYNDNILFCDDEEEAEETDADGTQPTSLEITDHEDDPIQILKVTSDKKSTFSSSSSEKSKKWWKPSSSLFGQRKKKQSSSSSPPPLRRGQLQNSGMSQKHLLGQHGSCSW